MLHKHAKLARKEPLREVRWSPKDRKQHELVYMEAVGERPLKDRSVMVRRCG